MLTELSGVASIINALKNGGDVEKSYRLLKEYAQGPNSISKKSKQNIYEYPLLVSSNIGNIDTITKIMKFIEIEYSSMLLVCMGINPAAKAEDNYAIKRYLSNYHTTGTDYSFSVESADYEHRSLTEATYEISSPFNPTVNARTNPNENSITGSSPSWRAPRQTGKVLVRDSAGNTVKDPVTNKDLYAEYRKDAAVRAPNMSSTFSLEALGKKYASDYNMTVINVQLRLGSEKDSEFNLPIGIRAIPYHLFAADLHYMVESFLRTRVSSGLTRFIQWRSGEIRSMKNLLFRYDEIKKDADFDRRIGTNNSWLKVLKSRGNNRRVNSLAKAGGAAFNKNVGTNDILPDCTFVLNLADIDTIEEKTGVNLFQNTRAASKFLDDSMGLGIIILDDGLNVAHILYSGEDKFKAVPLAKMIKDTKQDMTSVFLDVMKNTI